jgi:glutamine synthetase
MESVEEFIARQEPLIEDVQRRISENGIKVVIGAAADLNGIFRGKRVPVERFTEHPLEPVYVSDYFWAMDTEEMVIAPEPGYQGWWPSWEAGFGDVAPIPDLSTFRIVPWLDQTATVLCEHFFLDGRPIEIAPRYVLRRLVDRAIAQDLVPKFGAELEFFLFRDNEDSLEQKGYRSATLQPLNLRLGAYGIYRGTTDEHVIRPLAEHLEAFGIPIEYWNPEGGAGQYEVNMVYTDLLEAADRAFLYKHAVKEIAMQHGLMATFMAKTLPGFGSSCHLHQSVWSPDGHNLFWDEEADHNVSDLMRYYIGGITATMGEMTVLFAPTINSYKRLTTDSAAGTTATWGYENRTSGSRIIHENEHACRIEQRVPGGDCNPYLAMAGCIAGGLYGIENKIEPPEPTLGSAYADASAPQLPTSLEAAIKAFESGEVAKEYLGEEFVHFYAATRRWELEQFRTGVTDWEVKRYLQFL